MVVAALCYDFIRLPGAAWVAAVSAVLVTQPGPSLLVQGIVDARRRQSCGRVWRGGVASRHLPRPTRHRGRGLRRDGHRDWCAIFLKQDDVLRPAFVAVILVTLAGDKPSKWHNSIDRVTGVIIGCVCALVVGFLFDKLSGVPKLIWRKKAPANSDIPNNYWP